MVCYISESVIAELVVKFSPFGSSLPGRRRLQTLHAWQAVEGGHSTSVANFNAWKSIPSLGNGVGADHLNYQVKGRNPPVRLAGHQNDAKNPKSQKLSVWVLPIHQSTEIKWQLVT